LPLSKFFAAAVRLTSGARVPSVSGLPARAAILSCALLWAGSAGRVSAADCATPVFAAAPEYAAGVGPASVAAGDFNGDGVQDLALANLRSSNVSVLLGDGAGGFGPPANFGVSQEPYSVAVADFNKDGRADIAVGHFFGGGPVSALFGDGAGGFSPAVVVASIPGPNRVAVGDFNGDTNPDIAVGAFQSSPRILLGDGAGNFSVRQVSGVGGDSRYLAVGRLNGDAIDDVAFGVQSFPNEVVSVFGNGGGTFAASSRAQLQQSPKAVAAGDFNGDGRDDLAVTVEHSDARLAVLLNDGAGNFGSPANFRVGQQPAAASVADFNGDAKADIAVASTTENAVQVFVGDGLGAFTTTRVRYLTGKAPVSLVARDFDSDGKADLATANAINPMTSLPGTGTASVLLGDGAGAFASARAYSHYFDAPNGVVFSTLAGLAVADFNKNGRADVAVGSFSSSKFSRGLDDGAGGLQPPTLFDAPARTVSLASADFNGDANPDVVTADDPSGLISVYLGDGAGGFGAPANTFVSAGPGPDYVTTGEFNGDGKPDIAVSFRWGNIGVLLNNGSGGFGGFAANSPFVAGSMRFTVADFNGDGKDDIASGGATADSVTVFLNDGQGRMTASSTTPAPVNNNTDFRLADADFDLDGRADVVITNPEGNSVTVFLGDGAGGLGAGTTFAAGQFPVNVTVADFDGDTNPDVATSGPGGQEVSVLLGDGAGGFGPPLAYTIPPGLGELAAGLFDADSKPDLAVVSGDSVTILLNTLPASAPCISAGDVTVSEGDAGSVSADFTVTLSAASAQAVRVNYTVTGTNASAGADFTRASGRLVFAPGETSKTIPVSVAGDILDEADETFRLSLASPSGAGLADAEGLGTIIDDDPTPSLSINDVTANEGNPSFGVVFTVTLSAASGRAVTVNYSTVEGTATAFADGVSNDYSGPSGTLTIPAGQTTATINVRVFDEGLFEPDETFFINLTDPNGATITDAQGVATIKNDDPFPTLSVGSNPVTEGNDGPKNAPFFFSLSNPTFQTVTLNYSTADEGATAGSDYVAASGTITFNPGEIVKEVNFVVNGDTVDEAGERFLVNVGDVQNANAPTGGPGVVVIFDDDGPSVSVNDILVDEGQGGATNVTFTLTLSAPSPQAVTVRAATASVTATAFDDYLPTNVFVNFPVGTVTARVTMAVVGDTAVEPDESFVLNLSQPGNLTIADPQGVCVIRDDDGQHARFGSAAYNVNESEHKVTVTVTRTGDTSGGASVGYATADGTASGRRDYIAARGRLRFAPGEASASFDVLITDDRFAEPSETFTLTLGDPSGLTLGPPEAATVNIASDDAADGPSPVGGPAFDAQFFVRQHYHDFLNREPDAGGLNFWVNEIESCGADQQCRADRRENVSAAFFLSIEFKETGYLVERIYKAAYGDAVGQATRNGVPIQIPVPVVRLEEFLPDTQAIGRGVRVGLGDWAVQLDANKSAFAQEFVARPRFAAAFPSGMTPEQFVDKLDANAGGVLSEGERAALVAELAGNNTQAGRASVLRKVAENAELSRRELNRAFVLMQYFGYMRRNPNDPPETTHGGYNFWLQKLDQFDGNFVQAQMVTAFIDSIEYRNRFGQ
jgi:hypothetical protein